MTSGAFIPRSTHAWISVKHVPNGRIVLVNITEEKLSKYPLYMLNICLVGEICIESSGTLLQILLNYVVDSFEVRKSIKCTCKVHAYEIKALFPSAVTGKIVLHEEKRICRYLKHLCNG